MTNTCKGCTYHKHIHVAAHADYRDRCYRPRTMRNGAVVECGMNGFDAEIECDRIPELQRVANDKCGPTRIHWEAA